MDNPDAIIIDVRTDSEYNSGHLPGAINIDIQDYDFHSQVENLDPNNIYYVYCRSGARSATACKYMHSQGIQKAYNLKGGILAWNERMENIG